MGMGVMPRSRLVSVMIACMLIAACGDNGTTTTQSAATSVPAPTDTAPVITGVPATTASVGSRYSFTPTAHDSDGDALTFSITGRPSWATFDTASGQLRGTPGTSNVRTYGNIVISVTDGHTAVSLAAFSITVSSASGSGGGTGNTPPTISGAPASSVLQGAVYSFTPSAADTDGDTLTFSVTNQPAWASFSTASGRLRGTPSAADVGTTTGIVISVSDGQTSASLGPFSISVQAVATGSATLSWTPPTQNADGTPLTDLAGFKVYWGTSLGDYPNTVTLTNPGLTSYVVDQLTPATWYFVTTAFNSTGVESNLSNVATKTIGP